MAKKDFAAQPFGDENAESGDVVRMYIGNLTAGVTMEDVLQLLNMSEEGPSSLNIEKKKNHCFIEVPGNRVDELLLKNGAELNGRMLRVEIAEQMMETGHENLPSTPNDPIVLKVPTAPHKAASEEQQGSTETPVETTNELFIRFRGYMNSWDVPKYTDIALTAAAYFQVEGMMCRPIYVSGELVYKFGFRKEIPKDGHQLEFLCRGKTYKVPLYSWSPQNEDKRKTKRAGTLITMRRAGDGALALVPADEYDRALEKLSLELIVPTKFQRIKDTQVFNGNRFCVVTTPENLKSIPNSLAIRNPANNGLHTVRLTFKGQEVFCDRCQEGHVGQCPALKAFYEARKIKQQMVDNDEILSKIYSDSTLRHVETLGLTADVCAMSGGGIGQVIQASLDDPNSIKHERIVIMGGTNDMKTQNFPSTEVFAANVDNALQKLADAAPLAPEKLFFLVQQQPYEEETEDEDAGGDPRVPIFMTPEHRIRQLYLHSKMKDVANSIVNVETVNVKYHADHTGHPSEAGTAQILQTLHDMQLTPSSLIWNEQFIVNPKPYRGVESIFRYGCNACKRYGLEMDTSKHSHQLLCDECLETSMERATEPNPDLRQITDRINEIRKQQHDEAFPSSKRQRKDDSGDGTVETGGGENDEDSDDDM